MECPNCGANIAVYTKDEIDEISRAILEDLNKPPHILRLIKSEGLTNTGHIVSTPQNPNMIKSKCPVCPLKAGMSSENYPYEQSR